MKPKLLVIELWGVGDLAIATPFLRQANEHFDVTLLAKPFARDMQARFWPALEVIPFNAPWTAFNRKYDLPSWPWRTMSSVGFRLRGEKFDVALSARWDPRDHFLLRLTGATARLGFPRTGSQVFLTHPLKVADRRSHRYENWRIIAKTLNLPSEPREQLQFPPSHDSRVILVHTGAAQPVRIWPLERYLALVKRLRALSHSVSVVCNPEQLAWWKNAGEAEASAPGSIVELLEILDTVGLFVGNDSGPGHLAAACGVPTFTLFGPQLPQWFAPLHPAAEFIEGKPCPYKPCFDYCRFPTPRCLLGISEDEVWPRLNQFVDRHLKRQQSASRSDSLAFK